MAVEEFHPPELPSGKKPWEICACVPKVTPLVTTMATQMCCHISAEQQIEDLVQIKQEEEEMSFLQC